MLRSNLMTLSRITALLLTVFVGKIGFTQDLKIVPPTPNAMKMTEYYAQKPNMYTGTANVNIPLYTIDFDGWQLPLSISYNATGIRTNEEASEVGLGWALNATGVISRTVRGRDDLSKGKLGSYQGYVYATRPLTYDMGFTPTFPFGKAPAESYYGHLINTREDTEPDIFNYNFFGYSGSFVLSQKIADPNPDPTLRKVLVKKITEDACSILFFEDDTNPTFTVITPEGYKGEFTVHEKSTTLSSLPLSTVNRMSCCGQGNYDMTDWISNARHSGRLRTTTS